MRGRKIEFIAYFIFLSFNDPSKVSILFDYKRLHSFTYESKHLTGQPFAFLVTNLQKRIELIQQMFN
jgi:hypothetical protein